MTKIIRGAGAPKQQEPRAPIEAPDSLRSIAYARILDILSEGEIQGWSDPDHPLRCLILDGTRVENSDGTLNFQNLQVDTRTGTQTQDYIHGFDSTENEIGVAIELEYGTPWTQALSNLNLSAVRIRLSVPALSSTNVKNGDISGYKIDYKIEVSTDGGAFIEVLANSFNGKTTTKYERSHRIELPPADDTGWVVRVTRLTTNSTSTAIQDTTIVESYAELIDAKLRMPMTALNALTIDASQFNNIPSRAFDLKGRIIQVPSNYDPETRVYDGAWDGTFQSLYSDNPAWVFYDMLLNNRYGLGRRITAANINKWALYTIAQYCDELVDDGNGGEEPRFTCNVYLQNANDALRVIQDLATVFRGVAYAANGQVVAVADMPSDAVYTYNQSNVIDGKFVYSGTGRKVRHTVAIVSWNDLNDLGRAKLEYVEDEEGIARYGIQPTEVIAVGCTSQGQARRLGKHILTSERYETGSVSFGVGFDGTFAAPGRIIKVADPLRAGRRIGGRISAYSPGVVTVDHADNIEIGHNITCILPTGIPESREITGVAGNVLTLASAFSSAPVLQSVWLVESVELVAQEFRVISVAESDNGSGFNISAIQHEDDKYAAVEDGLIIEPAPITALTTLLPPGTVELSAYERIIGNLPVMVLVAEWEEVTDINKYEISIRRNNGTWTAPVKVMGTRWELEGAAPGLYVASVRSVSNTGYTSAQVFSVETSIETVNFTRIVDISSTGGLLTIDCSVSEQFRLLLIENIHTVVFENVSEETTLIIEVRQTGNFTISWSSNVLPASGFDYVVTTGGTPDVPKIDTVGLHTDTAGVNWTLRVDMDDSPDLGGSAGGFTITVDPSPAYGYAASNPSVAVTATHSGGTAPVTVQWARQEGGVGDWDGSTTNVGGTTAFTCSNDTSLSTTFSRTGTADGYVAQVWRIRAIDAVGKIAHAIVEVTLEDDGVVPGGGGPQCVWQQALLPDGRRARDVRVGSFMLAVDPVTLERKRVQVSYSKQAMAECVTLFTEDGTELTCSIDAPIPTPDGLVHAANMLGKDTITLSGWNKVVNILENGKLPVQHITCENSCFLAGNIKGKYMAHHNIKWYPGAPGTGDDPFTYYLN